MKKKLRTLAHFFKKYWYILLGFVFLVIIILSTVLGLYTDRIEETNTWYQVTPGHTQKGELFQLLGIPIRTESDGNKTHYYFKSSFPTIPTQITVNENQTVEFIEERIPFNPELTLSSYTQKHGDPELVLFDTESRGSLHANVFLNEGIVVFTHIKDNSVEKIWYFSPQTKEEFLENNTNRLSETIEDQEKFTPEFE